jgi:O-antigen/teichoic acid export membrane protein
MSTSQDGLTARSRVAASLRGHAGPHAVPVLLVGIATVVGVLAALAFQVISARAIGPEEFGLLAAFLAIINVAAFGSASLQNAVAVRTAEITTGPDASVPASRRRPSEATIIGLGGALVVAALAPVLVRTLNATPAVVLLAAAVIPLSFWLSEAVGVLQGVGRSDVATWWSSISLIARLALVLVALVFGLGIGGVLVAVFLGTALAVVGAGVPARRARHVSFRVFSSTGVTVLLVSLAFAWLVNADVIILRAASSGTVAGHFASAAILVKAAFILPSTLSVYLLPRFVRNRGNDQLVRVGERVTLAVTAISGALLALVFWLFGDLVARLVFGPAFAETGALLLPLWLAYIPWLTAQSVLIRLTAHAFRPAVVVLGVAAVAQAVGLVLAAPNVTAMIWVQGVIGIGVLAAFLDFVRRLNRRPTLDRESE